MLRNPSLKTDFRHEGARSQASCAELHSCQVTECLLSSGSVELCVPHLCSARSSPPACRKGQRKRETPLFRRHTFLYSSPPCTDMHVLSAWKRVVQKHLGPKGRFSDNRRVFVHCETNSSISWSVCLLTKP